VIGVRIARECALVGRCRGYSGVNIGVDLRMGVVCNEEGAEVLKSHIEFIKGRTEWLKRGRDRR
jgi:hypothetical protein